MRPCDVLIVLFAYTAGRPDSAPDDVAAEVLRLARPALVDATSG